MATSAHGKETLPTEDLAKQWLDLDEDEDTRSEIENLVKEQNFEELERRLRIRIAFGTAGLRARMEAGFSRMNSLTVIQASQGLADYINQLDRNSPFQGVVIGRDARHNSEKFAQLAAAAFVAKHFKVWWLEDIVHTPLVPFAIRLLGAAAGVMITASHNPSQDNGYKVYFRNGCQIIPPHDTGIAQAIDRNPKPLSWNREVVKKFPDKVEFVLKPVKESYYQAVGQAVCFKYPRPEFVYTPMHGVGSKYLNELLDYLERDRVSRYQSDPHVNNQPTDTKLGGNSLHFHTVGIQAAPNPDFPTVRFPNPEEKGALDAAKTFAASIASKKRLPADNVPLVIATDPDADRLAVAEYVLGTWHQFTGNQLGSLLASFVLSRHEKNPQNLMMLSSTVSSRMLEQMAKKEGFNWEDTLTGFKWLGNRAQELVNVGFVVPFAFEEAIGYMFTDVVFDKDGICTAAIFLEAAAKWKHEEGLSPWEKLQQLYQQYGYFADANTYLISPDPTVTTALFDNIRTKITPRHSVHPCPRNVGSREVQLWRDLTRPHEYYSEVESRIPNLPMSSDQMITFSVTDGVLITIRASGTEPKIKLYVEGRGTSMQIATDLANDVQQALIKEWFSPERWGLKLPD